MVTCADPEELRLLLSTLSANAFNFLFELALPPVVQEAAGPPYPRHFSWLPDLRCIAS